MGSRVAIFLHAGEYDRMHEALSVAAAAASSGRGVDVYFTWFALERLLAGALDAPGPDDFGDRDDLRESFAEKGFPSLRQLLDSARATGNVRLVACTGSLAIIGSNLERAREKVDELVGWGTILDRTLGVTDRFFY